MGEEADYMDDVQHASRYDDERRSLYSTHEVVDPKNRRLFAGSRSACWAYRKRFGGYVREKEGE